VLSIVLIAFFVVGIYRGAWRHFGMLDSLNVAKRRVSPTAPVYADHSIIRVYHFFVRDRSSRFSRAVDGRHTVARRCASPANSSSGSAGREAW
jgi:hypothetical protein